MASIACVGLTPACEFLDPNELDGQPSGTLLNYNCGDLEFHYNADLWTDGTIDASASVENYSLQSSYSEFYAPTQVGALTAPVNVVFDIAPPADFGNWTISFDRTTLVVSVQYNDVDVAAGEGWSAGVLLFTFPSSDCVLNTY